MASEKINLSDPIRLVVGLGNPGSQYQDTPHNVGMRVVKLLANRWDVKLKKHQSRTLTAQARAGIDGQGRPGPQVTLAVSQTYMNVSGGPLSRLADYLGIAPSEILVIHDDLDLSPHKLRLKRGGGEGGHNGLKSLSQHLGTKDYARLRIGIGRPPGRQNPVDYVIGKIPSSQRTEWDVTCQQAADTVEDVILRGFIQAQQDLHAKEGN